MCENNDHHSNCFIWVGLPSITIYTQWLLTVGCNMSVADVLTRCLSLISFWVVVSMGWRETVVLVCKALVHC